MGLGEKINKLKAEDEATFFYLVETKAAVLVSRNTEKCMFVVDSGASMHMLRKKDLSSDEMDTLRRSRNPTTVRTANGEVQTNEETQVYVMASICSSQCIYSMTRQQFCRLVSFAHKTDIHMSGKMVKTHN